MEPTIPPSTDTQTKAAVTDMQAQNSSDNPGQNTNLLTDIIGHLVAMNERPRSQSFRERDRERPRNESCRRSMSRVPRRRDNLKTLSNLLPEQVKSVSGQVLNDDDLLV